jgi:hypothetical protein
MLCARSFAIVATLASFMSLAAPALAHGGHCGGGHCGGHSGFSHSCIFGHSHISSSSSHMHISGTHTEVFAGMHSLNSTCSSSELRQTESFSTNAEHAHVGFFKRLFTHSNSSNHSNIQSNQIVVGNDSRPAPATCLIMPHVIQTNRIASITAFMTSEATVSAVAVTRAMKADNSDFEVMQSTDPGAGTMTNVETAPPAKMNLEIVPVQGNEEEQKDSTDDTDPANSATADAPAARQVDLPVVYQAAIRAVLTAQAVEYLVASVVAPDTKMLRQLQWCPT